MAHIAVLGDAPDEASYDNVSPCLRTCFRLRTVHKPGIKVDCFPEPTCGVPSCQEMLAAAKTARFQMLTGQLARTVTIGDKQFTTNPVDKTALEAFILELEYECGCYTKSGSVKTTGCNTGCNSGCGCSSPCGSCNKRPARLFTGYL